MEIFCTSHLISELNVKHFTNFIVACFVPGITNHQGQPREGSRGIVEAF